MFFLNEIAAEIIQYKQLEAHADSKTLFKLAATLGSHVIFECSKQITRQQLKAY